MEIENFLFMLRDEVEFEIENLTHTILDNPEDHLTDYFIEKLDEFLYDNLDVDGILDRILEVGVENITPFEKYFLDNDINPDKKFL